jgi:hypothetical protein
MLVGIAIYCKKYTSLFVDMIYVFHDYIMYVQATHIC